MIRAAVIGCISNADAATPSRETACEGDRAGEGEVCERGRDATGLPDRRSPIDIRLSIGTTRPRLWAHLAGAVQSVTLRRAATYFDGCGTEHLIFGLTPT